MKRTIQFERPPSIKLHYRTEKGKAVSIFHIPAYFVIRQASAVWVECKPEERLLKLADSQPNRFHFDQVAKMWKNE